MPRLYDISVAVNDATPPWPGDTAFSCTWAWRIASGASVNVSSLTASPHVGTHADAPLHVQDGWPAAHELPLPAFRGAAAVVDLAGAAGEISLDMLAGALGRPPQGALAGSPRLLVRTGRCVADGQFPDTWPVLSAECVRALLGFGLALLGTDAPSVDLRESTSLDVHRALFAGNAAILENLDLRHVQPGVYELIAFPLKLVGTDAAPVRAVLVGE